MNDLELLEEMYRRTGVEFTKEETGPLSPPHDLPGVHWTIEAGSGGTHNIGYMSSLAEHYFDEDG